MLFALVLGCAQSVRVQKFFGAGSYAMEAGTHGEIAVVQYAEGYQDDLLRDYAPPVESLDGRSMVRPTVITSRGRLYVDPVVADADLRLFVRHGGIDPTGFLPVPMLAGGMRKELPTELRPVPRKLERPMELRMADLHNVYNTFTFEDGDLLLLEVAEGEDVERYLFRTRQLGWRARAGAGVLVQLPLPGGDPAVTLSPVLALSFALGYRFPTRQPTARWIGDNLGLVVSLGVGSTAVASTATEVDVQQLDTLLNAALLGGGIELYDILSVQVFGNVSAPFRNAAEEPLTLAIGFDAVQFGRATRDAASRLLHDNALADPTW
ncbi:MAG: hypothetical protein H6736_17695 [Alphaproteobacteria bacterium]|nr:hypothetical protein [Alphaproteobacteria bacterium]